MTTSIKVKPGYNYIISDAGGSAEILNPRFQGNDSNLNLQIMFTAGTRTTMYKEIIVVAIKTK